MNLVDEGIQPEIYGAVVPWERPVQLAAEFFVRSGDTVLDIGGNTGGVAIAFARMVGPPGNVYSFECNPRMIEWIERDCAANNISNVHIIPFAAYKQSDVELTFYLDDSFYSAASSLHRNDLTTKISVLTTTIDKVCYEKDIAPTLIKIDIEGGEADAIVGGMETIRKVRPVIIMEFNPFADNGIRILQNIGYDTYDVNTYELVHEAYFGGTCSTNVVCLPSERRMKFRLGAPSSSRDGGIRVEAGHSVISLDLTYAGSGTGSLNCIGPDGKLVAYFEAEFEHLSHHSCATLPLYTPVAGEVMCEIRTLSGDGEISIASSTVRSLELVSIPSE